MPDFKIPKEEEKNKDKEEVQVEKKEENFLNENLVAANFTPLKLDIDDACRGRFFFSICSEDPYQEEISLFDGSMVIVLKERTVDESSQIYSYISKREMGLNIEYDTILQVCNLACSLVEIRVKGGATEKFSEKTFEEKIKRINSMSNQKFLLLVDCLNAFMVKISQLMEEAKKGNS